MKDKILIIESEQEEQSKLLNYLATRYDITFASEAQQAIDIAGEKQNKVIIYDLDNPKSKVITNLMKLKKSVEDVPIITITSVNTLEAEKTIRGIGIFYYLLKPYKATDFITVINAAIHLWERKYNYRKVV